MFRAYSSTKEYDSPDANVKTILSASPPDLELLSNYPAPDSDRFSHSEFLESHAKCYGEAIARSDPFQGNCANNVLMDKLQKEVEYWRNMYFSVREELIRCNKKHLCMKLPLDSSKLLGLITDTSDIPSSKETLHSRDGIIAEEPFKSSCIGFSGTLVDSRSWEQDVVRDKSDITRSSDFQYSDFAVRPPTRYHIMAFPSQFKFKVSLIAGTSFFCSKAVHLSGLSDENGVGTIFVFEFENRQELLRNVNFTSKTTIIETGEAFIWRKNVQVTIEIEAVINENAPSIKLQSMKPKNKDLVSDRYRQRRSFFAYESYRSNEQKKPTVKTVIGVRDIGNQLHLTFVKLAIYQHCGDYNSAKRFKCIN